MAATQEYEEQKRQFMQLVHEIASPEVLIWCREVVERRLAEVGEEKARCLNPGDRVEVTAGALAGRHGEVTARSCHAHELVLVQFEERDFPEPLPIPATALKRLAA